MRFGFIISIALFLSLNSFGQTAFEIIKKAENAIKGDKAYGLFEMSVVTPDYQRTMKMESWTIGNEKTLIIIKSPKKEAGNKTLKVGNELWNYLKNTETVIKLPPSMMLQSWNGSDFTNDDLVRESNLNEDYDIKLLADEVINGEKCWQIELLPKPDAPIVWGKLLYWVRQSDDLSAKIEYYNEKGKLVRHIEYSDYKLIRGKKMPAQWDMINDLKKGRHTRFRILDMDFNPKIKDRIFSLRELER